VQQNLPWILGTLAALLHGTGYVLYNIQTKRGQSRPNIVSWSIWAFMAGLNAFSFAEISSLAHALQYMVGTFAATITFILSFWWGRFTWPSRKEIAVFFICVVAVFIWWSQKDAGLANLLGCTAFLISFQPTFMGVYRDPHKEKPLAWNVWSLAFAVNLTNNIVCWQGDAVSIINPALLLVCHWSIASLSRPGRKRGCAT